MQGPPCELGLQLNQIPLWNALTCKLYTVQSKRSMMQHLILIFGKQRLSYQFSGLHHRFLVAKSVGWSVLHQVHFEWVCCDCIWRLFRRKYCLKPVAWSICKRRTAAFANVNQLQADPTVVRYGEITKRQIWKWIYALTWGPGGNHGLSLCLMLSSVFTDHFANDRAIAFANSWANARHSRTSIQPICIPCLAKQGKK